MDHIAIMKKSWGLIPKILDGRKKIESRWGKNRCPPWGRVVPGDSVYFKNAGGPVMVVAIVDKVRAFEKLNPKLVREILKEYGGADGIAITNLEETIKWASRKRYCTLIYLKDPKPVKPFGIDKRGFGTGAAWLSVNDINRIKRAS